MNRPKFPFTIVFGLLTQVGLSSPSLAQSGIDAAPIQYSKTEDNNSVSKLIDQISSGVVQLDYDQQTGYLKSILDQLEIPVSSQTLVFSKTSMQVRYISRQNPRAIYFNDDVYLAWVRGSPLIEISTADPKLGAAFYTAVMTPRNVYMKRANYDCLACHQTAMTQGIPGHVVRSVHARIDGKLDIQKESFVTDDSSPFSQRFGGWYVTGQHGDMKHMGNAFLRGGRLVTDGMSNRINLDAEFQIEDWLSPHSDIVALMVLGHQTDLHNALTVADFTVRRAQFEHDQTYGQPDPGSEVSDPSDAKTERQAEIEQLARHVVDKMLFVDEFRLTSDVHGSTKFANEFSQRGPFDSEGRSLREFDLKSRLFRYPCSYLVYSPAFDGLEKPLRLSILRRLWEILCDDNPGAAYKHINTESRQAILQILRETKPGLPDYWMTP